MTTIATPGVEIVGPPTPHDAAVLTPDALRFVATLARRFAVPREAILRARVERQRALDAGESLTFREDTRRIRERPWAVANAPVDWNDRRVEITGPPSPKMAINALNSGASVWMADFEDALSPTWPNLMEGQAVVRDAVRRTLRFEQAGGKSYALGSRLATLCVRPRGWHLLERHVRVDAAEVPASLFDFGLAFFHNAREQLARGSGPYFYLPKLESHIEARLWNDVFVAAQEMLGVPHGSIRATVLIETLPAAFEMEEILYELRDHAAGLNAGRWDYIFSTIKKLRADDDVILPDRSQVTMTVPFMRAYAQLLVRTCHRRGAHAIGGMAAFIPSRSDEEVNRVAIAKVRDDKLREVGDGFDGTWVAHPDLVPVARAVFDEGMGPQPNQKHVVREDFHAEARDLLDLRVPGGSVTEGGVRTNIDVGLRYIAAWLAGNGAVGIYNLMEDAATAEISRAQLWQWLHHDARLEDGRPVTRAMYESLRDEIVPVLRAEGGEGLARLDDAVTLLDALVLGETFVEFLTVPGYERLRDG
jgi:malate synthase